MPDYESSLRKCATEAVGALEWALKLYLRSSLRGTPNAERLKHPNFDELMTQMASCAQPSLEGSLTERLYNHRELLRNSSEHDAAIPGFSDVRRAIDDIAFVLTKYLGAMPQQLMELQDAGLEKGLKEEYFSALSARYKFMDLGGISPRIGSKVVKIRMSELFVSPRGREQEALFETFGDQASDDVSEVLSGGGREFSIDGGHSALVRKRIKMQSHDVFRLLENARVVLLGHPGSGKTTVTKYIAYSIATSRTRALPKCLRSIVPILAKAAEYAMALKEKPGTSFREFLVQRHSSRFGPLFDAHLRKGNALVIVDGLDEIADAELRILVSRRIEDFVSDFAKNRFLITSRIVGYRQNQLNTGFTHVTLAEFTDGQKLTFLEQWYAAIDAETEANADKGEAKRRANELWRVVIHNPGINRLAENPLLLTIIALANWRGTRLPSRRVELYQIATETLIQNWPLKHRGIAFDSSEILQLLEPIAFRIVLSGKNNLIDEYELRPMFENQVCEVRGSSPQDAKTISRLMLESIQEHTGFFLQKGFDDQGQGLFGFLHLTFAEYLAARHLADQWASGADVLSPYCLDSRWHEVILLVAGHIGTWATSQATRLVSEIRNLRSPYEDLLHRDLLLGAEIITDNVRIKREVQDELVAELMSIALSTRSSNLLSRTLRVIESIAKLFGLGHHSSALVPEAGDTPSIALRKAVLMLSSGMGDTAQALRIAVEHAIEDSQGFMLWDIFSKVMGSPTSPESAEYQLVVGSPSSAFYVMADETQVEKLRSAGVPFKSAADVIRRTRQSTRRQSLEIWILKFEEVLALPADEVAHFIAAEDWLRKSAVSNIVRIRGGMSPLPEQLLDR